MADLVNETDKRAFAVRAMDCVERVMPRSATRMTHTPGTLLVQWRYG